MLHHLSIAVSNLQLSGAFYDAALGALGYRRVFEDDTAIGYGVEDGQDKLCLKLRSPVIAPGPGFHVAFAAPSRAAVDRFHAAALAVGGQCNGAPGLRQHYGRTTTRPFSSTDGHAIEAVINRPEVS
jgi:catechol 2,3-dioxygenase-like lactoylglutathione lyase family enzyme